MFEPDDETGIHGFRPDVLLYWAPLSARTKNQVVSYPYKKAICFAGGPIDQTNVDGFDLYFTESKVNEDELTRFNKPWMRAFGINEQIFKPQSLPKKYAACFAGSFAKWKRPELFAKAVGSKGIAVGIFQDHEKECYEVCQQNGVETHDELSREEVATFINQSHCVVNPADLWGGGQRLTLEAMACNIPVICMEDSPKNREYIEESGYGMVAEPTPQAISFAVENLQGLKVDTRPYILSKFTIKHYADALEKGLSQL